MSVKTIAEVLTEHFPIDEWKGSSTAPSIRCACNCGSNFYVSGWARHVEEILMDLPVLASSAGATPKAELKPLGNNDLDAWGGFIKDTCIKFGVDVRIAWKVAGEFVYGLERERAK